MKLRRWLHRALFARRWLTFIVLCLSFFVFGAGTLNLFLLLKANTGLVLEHGWQALMDGAAMQFGELMLTGAVSMAAYVLFKSCEHSLVHWFVDEPEPGTRPIIPGAPARPVPTTTTSRSHSKKSR
ncbi:hypothetical protein [Rivibacter subsaxonicus]|uniref:Uncharacterized protein n=1 Tax=Rivibacter subsaxonicus TaxID=457575 RepID=A0A4Q7VNZ6_9BURK|nr:hypothetical protein [Rivibacter subsaxonicus]RZT98120.1 hypothetical protein EV670_2526 [Rivibacter subsaxonicus]